MMLKTLQHAKQQLRDAKIDSWALDAELLLCHVLGQTREFLLRGEGELTKPQLQAFEAYIARRLDGEPMSLLLGKREFWGREFKVTRDTLAPRADSETLIEAVLEHICDKQMPLNIIDLGTGTGCLLLTLLAEFPNAKGVGVDISPAAIDVADENAKKLMLDARVLWFNQSVTELDMRVLADQFDVVITNPPYIPSADIALLQKEVAHYEPMLALDGGDDGLEAYQAFAPAIKQLLKQGGLAVIEAGIGQSDSIQAMMEGRGLCHLESKTDLAGIARAIVVKK